jgi:hypothetical protein
MTGSHGTKAWKSPFASTSRDVATAGARERRAHRSTRPVRADRSARRRWRQHTRRASGDARSCASTDPTTFPHRGVRPASPIRFSPGQSHLSANGTASQEGMIVGCVTPHPVVSTVPMCRRRGDSDDEATRLSSQRRPSPTTTQRKAGARRPMPADRHWPRARPWSASPAPRNTSRSCPCARGSARQDLLHVLEQVLDRYKLVHPVLLLATGKNDAPLAQLCDPVC